MDFAARYPYDLSFCDSIHGEPFRRNNLSMLQRARIIVETYFHLVYIRKDSITGPGNYYQNRA